MNDYKRGLLMSGLILAVIIVTVMGLMPRERAEAQWNTPQQSAMQWVAVKEVTVNAGATSTTGTLRNCLVGNVFGAVHVGSASVTTNTAPAGAHCATEDVYTIVFDSAVASTSTYAIFYKPTF